MSRRLALLAFSALAACKPSAGPPSQIGLTAVYGNESMVEVRASLMDESLAETRPEGATVHYTLYEGPPSRKQVLCTASGPLSSAAYDVPKGVEYAFAARVTFPQPCKPPVADLRYGVVSVTLNSGATVTDQKASFVPSALGGDDRFSFPEYYERDVAARSAAQTAALRGAALTRSLAALGSLTAEGAPPLDQPCPALSSRAVMRADQRVLAGLGSGSIAPDISELAFTAMNDEAARALARQQKVPAEVDLVELVQVHEFEAPSVVDNGYRDGQSKGAGTYRPGVFLGEVWVVDVRTRRILCRAQAAASSTSLLEGKSFELGAKMERAFADRVGAELNRAARTLAPALPNTWP